LTVIFWPWAGTLMCWYMGDLLRNEGIGLCTAMRCSETARF
jgi:hypothetical protein